MGLLLGVGVGLCGVGLLIWFISSSLPVDSGVEVGGQPVSVERLAAEVFMRRMERGVALAGVVDAREMEAEIKEAVEALSVYLWLDRQGQAIIPSLGFGGEVEKELKRHGVTWHQYQARAARWLRWETLVDQEVAALGPVTEAEVDRVLAENPSLRVRVGRVEIEQVEWEGGSDRQPPTWEEMVDKGTIRVMLLPRHGGGAGEYEHPAVRLANRPDLKVGDAEIEWDGSMWVGYRARKIHSERAMTEDEVKPQVERYLVAMRRETARQNLRERIAAEIPIRWRCAVGEVARRVGDRVHSQSDMDTRSDSGR